MNKSKKNDKDTFLSEIIIDKAIKMYREKQINFNISHLKNLMIDQMGLMLGGQQFPWSKAVYQATTLFKTSGNSTIAFYGDAVSPHQASFVNASFSHAQDFDDTHLTAITHPGSIIFPAALAVSEEVSASGLELLKAVSIGIEIACLLSHNLTDTFTRGHHSPLVCGQFGVCVTVGLLLKLSRSQLLNSFLICGSYAGGLAEYSESGGSVKRIHCAISCQNGIQASYLALKGITGPISILEGKKGLLQAFGINPNDQNNGELSIKLTKSFNHHAYLDDVAIKLYNCCYPIQPAIICTLQIIKENKIQIKQIKKIRIGFSRWAKSHAATIKVPHDAISAQFCTSFCIALSIIKGPPGMFSYNDDNIHNAEIIDYSKKVGVFVDQIANAEHRINMGCIVTIYDDQNRAYEKRLRHAKGSKENPASKSELRDKFFECTSNNISKYQAKLIYNNIQKIENCQNIKDFTKLLSTQNDQNNLSETG